MLNDYRRNMMMVAFRLLEEFSKIRVERIFDIDGR